MNQEKDTCEPAINQSEYIEERTRERTFHPGHLDGFNQRVSTKSQKYALYGVNRNKYAKDRTTENTYHLGYLADFGQRISTKYQTPEPASYTEVINYLERVRNDLPDERIIISHRNSRYPEHRGSRWCPDAGHTDDIDKTITFVKERRDQENANKKRQINKLFVQFAHAINDYKKKGGKEEVIAILVKLGADLEAEINADRCYYEGGEEPEFKGPDLNKTYYPIILKHFIQLTKNMAKHPEVIDVQEINDSKIALEKKINEGVSGKLRATLAAVFSALSGALLGAAIGAVTMGGIGAIPTAIAGAAIGLTGSGVYGFFHAKKEKSNIAARRVVFDIYQNDERKPAKPQEQAQETLEQIKALYSSSK